MQLKTKQRTEQYFEILSGVEHSYLRRFLVFQVSSFLIFCHVIFILIYLIYQSILFSSEVYRMIDNNAVKIKYFPYQNIFYPNF